MPNLSADLPLDRWLDTARRAADAAAAVHAEWSGRVDTSDADMKGMSDWVSHVDVSAQEAALAIIRDRHPDHLILAEEGDAARVTLPADDTPIWIVDPLDGTTNFLHGHPMFGASVAVASGGDVMAGAVTAAALGHRWWARRGGGAFRDGQPIRVSAATDFGAALVATGFPFKAQHLLEEYASGLVRVLRAGAGVRRDGAAAIDLCLVADGRFEAFWELSLSPWDYAAGALIVEEAGGVTGRVAGDPLGLEPGTVAAAASPEFLAQVRTLASHRG